MLDELYFKAANIVTNYFLKKEWKFTDVSYITSPYENIHLLLDYPNYEPIHINIREGKVMLHSLYKLGDYANADNLTLCEKELNEPGLCLCESQKCGWLINYDSFALYFEFPLDEFDETKLDDVVKYYRRHKSFLDEVMNTTAFKWNRKKVTNPKLIK